MLNRCIKKLNEVALDLREPQDGSSLEHQAKKIDRVREELEALLSLMVEHKTQTPSPSVHGGGTGRE